MRFIGYSMLVFFFEGPICKEIANIRVKLGRKAQPELSGVVVIYASVFKIPQVYANEIHPGVGNFKLFWPFNICQVLNS